MSWTFLQQVLVQLVSLIVTAVLARQLDPSQFGLLGMVMVLSQFGHVFSDMGTASLVVTRKNLDDADLSTIFWINLLLGVAMTLLVIAASPWIAAFFNQPLLSLITKAIAFNFLISALGATSLALLQRQMNFRSLFAVQLMASFVSGTVAITTAVSGFGVWALVWRSISLNLAITLLAWLISSWSPSFHFKKDVLREVWRYGASLTGNRVLNYWLRNFDNLMVGKYWGEVALGFYDLAYRLMRLPLTNSVAIVSTVMLPSLALIQNDKNRVKNLFLRTLTAIVLVAFPICLFFTIFAHDIVLCLYGPNWEETVPLLRVLSLLGLVQSVSMINSSVFESQNRTKLLFWSTLPFKAALLVVVLVAVRYGVLQLAIACTVGSFLVTFPYLLIVGSVINVRFAEIASVLVRPLFATGVMASAGLVFAFFFPATNVFVRLFFGVVLCSLTFSFCVWKLRIPAAVQIIEHFQKKYDSRFDPLRSSPLRKMR